MSRYQRNTRLSGRPLRGMDWGVFQASGTGAAVSAAWILPPGVARLNFVDPTLMATRLNWALRTTAALGAGVVATLGIIAWDHIDDTTPANAPNPNSAQGNMDWIIRSPIIFPLGTPSLTNVFYYNENL